MTDTDVSEAKNPSPATDLDEDSDEDTLALVTESNRGVELDKFRTTHPGVFKRMSPVSGMKAFITRKPNSSFLPLILVFLLVAENFLTKTTSP